MTSKSSIASIANKIPDLFPRLFLAVFLSGAMRGYSMPYLNLFLTENGFSGTLIGTLVSSAALIELILIPAISKLADRTRTHRLVFQAMSISFVTACLFLILVPYRAVLIACILVVHVSLRSTFIYALQLSVTKLQQYGKTAFGRIRSTSAGGFMIANLTAGMVFGLGRYVALFSFAIGSGLLAVFFSNAMPENTVDKPEQGEAIKRNAQLFIVLASQFFVTMGLRNGFTFWLVHFQDNLGITTIQISILITLAAGFEIPWFLLVSRMLKQSNATSLYTLGVIGFAIQWVFIGLVPNFTWILILLVPRGMMFALWNLSVLIRIDQISHPRNVSTNQALANITIPSVAILLSGAPMGYIYDNFTPLLYFSICAVMMLIGATIMFISSKHDNRTALLATVSN